MARYAVLQSFYASKEYRNFRMALILKRAVNGIVICEDCGQPITKSSDIHLDHKVELTPENVHDKNISLNPALAKLIHKGCHDKRHHRFGYNPPKKVYLVYGPPMSGKTTFVLENMERGDLVVDMNTLYRAVSMRPYYDKPNNLLSNIIGLRQLLIDNVKTRYGKWYNAWIVGGYADKFKRERLSDDIGAELVYIKATKEECFARLATDKDRKYRQEEWKKYIDEWFEKYGE